MDEALKFITAVGEADIWYMEALRRYPDITYGAIQQPSYFHLPPLIEDILKGAVERVSQNIMYPFFQKFSYSRIDALRDVVSNPDEIDCIHDELTYDLKEYLVNGEVPYVANLISQSDLRNHVSLPDNLQNRIDQLKSIPLCRNHKQVLPTIARIWLK